jgi:hypothetical protein
MVRWPGAAKVAGKKTFRVSPPACTDLGDRSWGEDEQLGQTCLRRAALNARIVPECFAC